MKEIEKNNRHQDESNSSGFDDDRDNILDNLLS
jgi:hypothetical protein